MSFRSPDTEIIELDRVEIAVEPWAWEFAHARRAEIDRHFASRQRERPALWNGRVLLVHRYGVDRGVLRGACFETDYASFLAWRDWDLPDAGVFNVFAAAALQAADGAYLVGEMAPSTATAGQLYFPCGTPDPVDITAGGTLDLAGSLARELLEETGIDIATLDAAPGWCLVRDRGYLALDEAAHGTAKRRGASLGHLAPSGERAAAGIVRRPHRARAGGFRSADAGLHRRVPGASLAAVSGRAGLARPVSGELAQTSLLPLQGVGPISVNAAFTALATLGPEGR